MEQTVLAWHKLYEAAVRHDAAHGAFIDLAYLGHSDDGLNLCHSCVDALLVGTADLNLAYAILFVDGDGGACLFLHTLDNLSARADDGTDEFLRDNHLLDARHVRLQLWTWFVERLHHLCEDMLAACLCLHEGLFENLIAESIALDVHLCSGQAVGRTGCLEVHIAEVVLVAKDVREYCVLVFAGVLDETHSDATDGSLDGHTGVHECQAACTGAGH